MVATLDWIVVLVYVAFSLGVGIFLSKYGTRSTKDYFTSGGGMPWWILGTSMVATTFAADTPLAISSMVVTKGISGQWFWWCQVPITMLGVFFFARLWQRVGVLTDNEFVHVRYSGTSSKALRCFRGLYFSLVYQTIVMGWVNLAMVKIIGLTVDIGYWPVVDDALQAILANTMGLGQDAAWFQNELPAIVTKMKILLVCFLVTLAYTSMSGLWGVLITDFFQFFLAMGGTILLAVLALRWAGGMESVLARLAEIYGPAEAENMVKIVPVGTVETAGWGSTFMAPIVNLLVPFRFMIYVGLLWWTLGYTDGGSYLAQRMLAAKDERHSMLAYLWYGVCHYCIRPWPWLIVGLVAAVKFPYIADAAGNMPDPELGYIKVMLEVLPAGVLGLLLAAFLAAYMSTISTQINLGASYLVNDVYRPFLVPGAPDKHYVYMSILASVFMAFVGIVVTLFMSSIESAWYLLAAINAGIGIVYILRWYWWRVNAWSEISCLAACVSVVGILKLLSYYGYIESWSGGAFTEVEFPYTLLITVPVSLLVWLPVTYLTKPVDESQLKEFYRRVQPGGPGWKRIAAEMPASRGAEQFTRKNTILFLVSVVALYSALVGVGELILGHMGLGLALMAVTVVAGVFNVFLALHGEMGRNEHGEGFLIYRRFQNNCWVERREAIKPGSGTCFFTLSDL